MRLTPRVAGFRSEYPAGFKLECMAGFVGTRSLTVYRRLPFYAYKQASLPYVSKSVLTAKMGAGPVALPWVYTSSAILNIAFVAPESSLQFI